jgi:hypothetical protein
VAENDLVSNICRCRDLHYPLNFWQNDLNRMTGGHFYSAVIGDDRSSTMQIETCRLNSKLIVFRTGDIHYQKYEFVFHLI